MENRFASEVENFGTYSRVRACARAGRNCRMKLHSRRVSRLRRKRSLAKLRSTQMCSPCLSVCEDLSAGRDGCRETTKNLPGEYLRNHSLNHRPGTPINHSRTMSSEPIHAPTRSSYRGMIRYSLCVLVAALALALALDASSRLVTC